MLDEPEIVRAHEARGRVLAGLVLLAFFSIIIRLWYLQVYKGELLLRYSLENRLREETIWAPRGMIYDRNEKLIVDNRPRYDVVITRQFLNDKKQTLDRLSEIISMEVSEIERSIRKRSFEAKYRPIIIKKNISMAEIAQIETNSDDLPGVTVQLYISREYLDEEIGAHLLGYISEISKDQLPKYRERDEINYQLGDVIGQYGIEEEFDSELRGQNGREYVEVDALGRKRKYINTNNLFKGIEDIPAKPGRNLKLTIDRDLQIAGYKALKEESGSAVAINIKTGEVLAMVSTPSFRPSEFSRGLTASYWSSLINNPENPLRDRTIQEHYSPGSTFKVITAIAGLHHKVLNPRSRIVCSGGLRFGNRTYHCWKKGGHGEVDLRKAIQQSCNVYFQKLALKLDIDQIAEVATDFGLGSRSGIKLTHETSGLIPTKEWKLKKNGRPWQRGETLSCAIGQSYILSTTLQLAMLYGGIANNGEVFRPKILSKIFDEQGLVIEEFEPESLSRLNLEPKIFEKIKQGLYDVVNRPGGTAYWHRAMGLEMAGKTGTSQVIGVSADKVYQKCEQMPRKQRHHGIFAGFLPFDDPQIAVAAVVEHGCHGSTAAVPIVSAIAEEYMKKYLPEKLAAQSKVDQKKRTAYIKARNAARESLEKEKKATEADSIQVPTVDNSSQAPPSANTEIIEINN